MTRMQKKTNDGDVNPAMAELGAETGLETGAETGDAGSGERESVKKAFKDTDGIRCRSITPGTLVMHGIKTNIDYVWEQDGLDTEIEYQDLVAAVRTRSVFIYGPHIIIEDMDFLDEWPDVKKIYDNMYSSKDLREILGLPVAKMRKEIGNLPDGAKKSILALASDGVANGGLDSLSKIKAINEIFNVDLMLLSGYTA